MAYNFIDSYPGQEGVIPLLFAIRDAVPLAFESFLFVFMLIVGLGSFFAATSETARGKFIVSFAAATFVTTIVSVFFAMMTLITVQSLMVFVTLTIASFLILIFYK